MLSIPFAVLTQEKIDAFKLNIIKLDNGCWDFDSAKDAGGYNKFTVKKSVSAGAHRVSWQIFKGTEGLTEFSVLHKCDNPYCVNPDHLYLGTPKQNVDDMFNRDRQWTTVTRADVPEIKRKYATGDYSQTQLAKMYNVTQPQISKIINGTRWQQYA